MVEQKTFFGSTPKIESGNTLEEEFFLIKPAAGGTTGFCGLVLLLFLSNFREQSHEFLQSAIDLRAAPRVMRDIWTFPTKDVCLSSSVVEVHNHAGRGRASSASIG